MKYAELFKESNEEIRERYELSMERIDSILNEEVIQEPVKGYFKKAAEFILKIKELVALAETDKLSRMTLEELKKLNYELYEDVIPGNYENSFGNPRYAVKKLGKVGKLLSFLYAEIRGMIVYAYECRLFDITIYLELFIEVYNYFEEADEYTYKDVKRAIYDFISDYTGDIIEYRTRELIDPELSFVNDIIRNWDLKDLRYLYQFGEYIGENEIKTAEFLNSLTEEEVKAMAFTYKEGYRRGFEAARIDLSKKESVNIRYNIGFERMLYYAVEYFEEMRLKPVIYRAAVNTVNKKQHLKIGFHSTGPNKQYDYDHRFDNGLYLDKAYNERKLSGLRKAFEKYKNEAAVYAGPAVIEVFGEKNFAPENKTEVIKLDKRQQKLYVSYNRDASLITNEYIKGEETSFTIIAYPIPEIGEKFKNIFADTVKVNTLDNQTYKEIQQSIIDVLDQGEYVKILGRGKNRTNLKVMLYELTDPGKETIFENCTADVNIPVGEVFTSPKLTGTKGTLHVTQVYLHELEYIDLELQFEDGKISSYTCRNFESEEDNKQFVRENLMYNQETLPLGEFAIGTNTTAYVMAQKYNIGDKLPILIAEKTGPHFAVGDTCYKMSEDLTLYNPDGKLIVAKDNEISILRKTDMDKAYFNCHTDITIPYDELGEISVYKKNGETITIIKDGRFILPGTEKLNEAFR
ncbi:aminopeptidase [Anaerocolumna sp. MB42-C2]|uniref:aminopeptidase n=1 Tax=Anaerocolumna sp. MB42-C2 TaxID=3070997 RepID=UPI0027DFE6A7|nr:aminopeptidase [Anaerocolumna sp. MB42-C2]WMJ89639.1 aminopeptidase [Anaerocolumna sp. MB42-C2]